MDHSSKDLSFLSFIDPPETFPPSALDLTVKIQETFYRDCQHFLKAQSKFYQCSKAVQNRLSSSLQESACLDVGIRSRSAHLQSLGRELRKINFHYAETQQKEEFLGSVCKFVNMQQARKIMLQTKIADEDLFIEKLKEVDKISQQLASLSSNIRIVGQIKEELSSLLVETVDKMIKGNISDNLIRRITSDFWEPFMREGKIASIFITNLTNHRLNLFRVGLNPLINNINYVQNVNELYQKITDQWVSMLEQEMQIFGKQQTPKEIRSITKEVMGRLVAESMPKMERGIYKLKNIVDISKIRSSLRRLRTKLDECGDCAWDPLPKLLMKMSVILEEKLDDGAEKLQIAKYNIYSLVSYVPIREYLQEIKEARAYDTNARDTGWERGFKRLADSRDPAKQPNNKSLIIFNLNIWYLYSHVMKQEGEMLQRAQAMIRQNMNAIVTLNLAALRKEYESKALQKLLDLCADAISAKRMLQSEIHLLGHEKLRTAVEKQLVSKFIGEIYLPILESQKLTQGLENAEVVELSRREKLNLNKYGKGSENLRIFTADEMKRLLS